ncbi:MAG: hypothetical protein GXO47_05380 [Chlorobi bacterium]|nr:hypothetical protein [Chlorobiota bacterium]
MKLIFTMKYADKKWPEYIEEVFGKEIAEQARIESDSTAKNKEARIHLMNFKNDTTVIEKLKNNENVISAFLVSDNEVKETIKG